MQNRIRTFNEGIESCNLKRFFIPGNSSIKSCIVGDISEVKNIAKSFRHENIDIKAILSPTVPLGTERLRICLHSFNSVDEINRILNLFSNFTANLKGST